jgi:hypothetical protein
MKKGRMINCIASDREKMTSSHKLKHGVSKKTYEYGYGDCILYRIFCLCGKECGGWTIPDAENDFEKHIKEMKLSNKA